MSIYFHSAGGTYLLDINIPETYPFNPPKVSINSYLKTT